MTVRDTRWFGAVNGWLSVLNRPESRPHTDPASGCALWAGRRHGISVTLTDKLCGQALKLSERTLPKDWNQNQANSHSGPSIDTGMLQPC